MTLYYRLMFALRRRRYNAKRRAFVREHGRAPFIGEIR